MKHTAASHKPHGSDSCRDADKKTPVASMLLPVLVLSLAFSLTANLAFLQRSGGLFSSRGQQVHVQQTAHPAAASEGMRVAVGAAAALLAKELPAAAVVAADTRAAAVRSQWGLFVGVLSAAGNVEARQAIRDTWGADPRLLRVMFFTLRPKSNETFLKLQFEAAQYGDLMVVSEVPEDYYNITHSTLALFRAAAACPQVNLALKLDDDAYLRVPVLLKELQGAPSTWLYAGWPMVPTPIPREGRFGIPLSNWASNDSVVYGWGVGYVLSIDLARLIAAGAPHHVMQPDNLLRLEDMAVGIWVDKMAKIHNATVHHLVFHYNYSTLLTGCDTTAFSSHMPEPRAANMRCTFERGGQCCGV